MPFETTTIIEGVGLRGEPIFFQHRTVGPLPTAPKTPPPSPLHGAGREGGATSRRVGPQRCPQLRIPRPGGGPSLLRPQLFDGHLEIYLDQNSYIEFLGYGSTRCSKKDGKRIDPPPFPDQALR